MLPCIISDLLYYVVSFAQISPKLPFSMHLCLPVHKMSSERFGCVEEQIDCEVYVLQRDMNTGILLEFK